MDSNQSQQVKQEAEKRYPYFEDTRKEVPPTLMKMSHAIIDVNRLAFISGFEYGQQQGGGGLKITFTDCWEVDERINSEQRWMAHNDFLKIAVTAPTKEKVFEEFMTSLRVMIMFLSDYKPESPASSVQKEGWEWTDELVKEFVELITTEPNKDFVRVYTNDRMIEFKESKNPLPSPPTTDKK